MEYSGPPLIQSIVKRDPLSNRLTEDKNVYLPIAGAHQASVSNIEDEYTLDYAFAIEYTGPPVSYDIPLVVPVDVNWIPMAVQVSSSSSLSNLSLPVVQPIVKTDYLSRKFSKERKLDKQTVISPVSVINSGEFDGSHVVRTSNALGTSLRVVNEIYDSGQSGFSDGYVSMARSVMNGNVSSGTLLFSESHDDSHDLWHNSDMDGVFDDQNEDVTSDLDRPGLKSPGQPYEITSLEEEESVRQARPSHRRTKIVTFRDPEMTDIDHEENEHDEVLVIQERKRRILNIKKGLCHQCLEGNWLTPKETCLVCGAKYCCKCVLRAMGSMPEGRKCITCIGYRIDESKRTTLGKSSRLLKRLHVGRRAKEILSHEKSCNANQIPPQLICVNGKPLTQEEQAELLGCPNPPRKLKLKNYWYDKESGLWGKEGKKPCQIISSRLSVGGQIMRNASNGKSDVVVNNRIITKPELWMLLLAGINCDGGPHFLMSADGSLQEEASMSVRKRTMSKPINKLVSAILSLPIPATSPVNHTTMPILHESPNSYEEVNNEVVLSSIETYKLLMVGSEKSGTSTIFKQAKILYNVPFSEDEHQNSKFMIQTKLYKYIDILLQSKLYNYLRIMFQEFERSEEESLKEMTNKSIDQPVPSDKQNPDQIANKNISLRLAEFSDLLHEVMMSGDLVSIFPIATREFAPLVEELWKDRAFQATYNRRNEVQMLPDGANYYLDRAVEISSTNYEPSDMDILHAEGITSSNGIASMEFSFPMSVEDMDTADHNDPSKRYQLISVHPSSLGKNCKWLSMFEEVDLFVYCVSLTDYNQFSYDNNGVATNKMLENKKLFETIVNHPDFYAKNFLLILTKFDLFKEMMEQFPLTRCEWFHDFNPVARFHSSDIIPQNAFHYIATKFKYLFYCPTGSRLFVSLVAEQEAYSVDAALKYAREVLVLDYVSDYWSEIDTPWD